MLLAYEVTRDLPLEQVEIETPLVKMKAPQISGKKLCLVSILRAGNGMLDGMLEHPARRARGPRRPLPRSGHARSPSSTTSRCPRTSPTALVIVVDPMLATGHSAVAALNRLKEAGAVTIKYVCLLAAPEGIAALQGRRIPTCRIFTAAVDDHLNEHGYIIPGLGDAGDRLFGTK